MRGLCRDIGLKTNDTKDLPRDQRRCCIGSVGALGGPSCDRFVIDPGRGSLGKVEWGELAGLAGGIG